MGPPNLPFSIFRLPVVQFELNPGWNSQRREVALASEFAAIVGIETKTKAANSRAVFIWVSFIECIKKTEPLLGLGGSVLYSLVRNPQPPLFRPGQSYQNRFRFPCSCRPCRRLLQIRRPLHHRRILLLLRRRVGVGRLRLRLGHTTARRVCGWLELRFRFWR